MWRMLRTLPPSSYRRPPSPGCLRTARSGTLWPTSWQWTGTRVWADLSDTSWTQSEDNHVILSYDMIQYVSDTVTMRPTSSLTR